MVKPREGRHQYWCTTQYRTRLTDRPGKFHLPIGIGVCRRCIPMFLCCMSQIGIIKCACSMAERACGKQSRSLGIYRRHMIPDRHNQTWAKRKTLFTISYKIFSGINTLIFKICAVEASHFYKGIPGRECVAPVPAQHWPLLSPRSLTVTSTWWPRLTAHWERD